MTSRSGVRLLAVVSSISMVAAVAAGLYVTGSPMHQRALRLDSLRISGLRNISTQITAYWSQYKALPPDLTMMPGMTNRLVSDPISGKPYEYIVTGPETYKLCAHFDVASESEGTPSEGYVTPYAMFPWKHPAGTHCFNFQARSNAITIF